jgi:protoporphyrinogen oxidase
MRSVFGDGITRHFMAPYNFKVWATPAEEMASDWIAERISVVDYERARRNVREGRDDIAWGPNNRFVFPALGGTGEIYTRIAAGMRGRIRYRQEVVEVNPRERRLRVASGEEHSYGSLVSTAPLDQLVRWLDDCPDELRSAAAKLRHNGVYMVGVGYEQSLADDKSWMYFPHDQAPFYRATNFAKYSPANVPDGNTSRYSAYMTETSFSAEKPVAREGLEDHVEEGLRAAGVVDARPPVASLHLERIDYAYPVPTLGRRRALETIQPWLMERGIYSRGRFGSWRYEIGNMDHAVKMGVDIARRLVRGDDEELWAQ